MVMLVLFKGWEMGMSHKEPDYYAYLLRLWRVDGDAEPAWRASLQDATSGEEAGFPDLAALFEYLRQVTRALPGEDKGRDAG
jgi:hypothetical protein